MHYRYVGPRVPTSQKPLIDRRTICLIMVMVSHRRSLLSARADSPQSTVAQLVIYHSAILMRELMAGAPWFPYQVRLISFISMLRR
jgi:hypothetical protein